MVRAMFLESFAGETKDRIENSRDGFFVSLHMLAERSCWIGRVNHKL
jgi:hypothetical protein